MYVPKSGRDGGCFKLKLCVGLWCLASTACGQTADTSKADSSTSGGTSGSASGTGGQSESTGGSSATGGGESIASGGSTGIVVSTGGFDGTGGVATSASGGDGAGVATHPAKPCNNPAASPWGGGLLLCGDGSYRRPQAESCNTEVPRAEPGATCHPGDECCLDSDCGAAPFGFCSYGACLYGCVSDSDCASDSLCLCQDPIGRCTLTACHSDAECAPDYPCTAAASLRGFSCQHPTDGCVSNFDCSTGLCLNGACVHLPG